jgi:hypothetical protein
LNTLITDVHAILSTTPDRWQRLVDTLPIDLLSRPPAEGEWSALNCLQHLLVAERDLFPVRFQALLNGGGFVDFDPNEPHLDLDVQLPQQLLATFTHLRQQSLTMLSHVSDEDLQRISQHPKLGTVTLAQLLNTWAAHDLNHTIQAERALIQPFMFACGPWRSFFHDHELSAIRE